MADFPIFDRLKEIIETIEECIQKKRMMTALVLIYSLIDSISWLASENINWPVKKRFTLWVDNWMLNEGNLKCTAIELYAARCGILHTLTSDSELSNAKKVRRVAYSFGDRSPVPLQIILDHLNPKEFVTIRIEELYNRFMNGLVNFVNDTMVNNDKKKQFEKRATRYFSYFNPILLEEISSKLK